MSKENKYPETQPGSPRFDGSDLWEWANQEESVQRNKAMYWQMAYDQAVIAIHKADAYLADMHEGSECKFNGGDGCLACCAQQALMGYQTGRAE